MARETAAGVIIGNEVLSSKVVDENGPLLAQRLKEVGLSLRGMIVIPDEVDAIVEAIFWARARAVHVFTSGGIGPTHDDVTVRAVALALGRRVVRNDEIAQMIQEHLGDRLTPEALRMAEVPEGTRLLWKGDVRFPVLSVSGVYLLPGVPQLFRVQLESVLLHLKGTPQVLRCLYLDLGETQIARALDEVAMAMPDVQIGSYPLFGTDVAYRVKVTVEHVERRKVDAAVESLLQKIPREGILSVE